MVRTESNSKGKKKASSQNKSPKKATQTKERAKTPAQKGRTRARPKSPDPPPSTSQSRKRKEHPTEEEHDGARVHILNGTKWLIDAAGLPIGDKNAYVADRYAENAQVGSRPFTVLDDSTNGPERRPKRAIVSTAARRERESLSIQTNPVRPSKNQAAIDREAVNDLAPSAPVSRQRQPVEEDRPLVAKAPLPTKFMPTIHEEEEQRSTHSKEKPVPSQQEGIPLAKTYKQHRGERLVQYSQSDHTPEYGQPPYVSQQGQGTPQNRGVSQGVPNGQAQQQYTEPLRTTNNGGSSQFDAPPSRGQQQYIPQYAEPPRTTAQNGGSSQGQAQRQYFPKYAEPLRTTAQNGGVSQGSAFLSRGERQRAREADDPPHSETQFSASDHAREHEQRPRTVQSFLSGVQNRAYNYSKPLSPGQSHRRVVDDFPNNGGQDEPATGETFQQVSRSQDEQDAFMQEPNSDALEFLPPDNFDNFDGSDGGNSDNFYEDLQPSRRRSRAARHEEEGESSNISSALNHLNDGGDNDSDKDEDEEGQGGEHLHTPSGFHLSSILGYEGSGDDQGNGDDQGDEDDQGTGGDKRAQGRARDNDDEEESGGRDDRDVLATHRKTNKATRPPDPAMLELSRRKQQPAQRKQQPEVDSAESSEDDRQRKPRTQKDAPSKTDLGYHPAMFQQVVELAKLHLQCWMVENQFFPTEKEVEKESSEFLDWAFVAVQDEHRIDLSTDHKPYFIKMLWAEVSHFRGEAKTDTRPVAKKYNFAPNWKNYIARGSNQNEYFKDLASNVKDLVTKAKFAHGGPTQNFQAPELGEAVANLLFHKSGSHRVSIGEKWPERFQVYSPNLIAAGAAVLKNTLDEHDDGHFRTIKLQSVQYRKFYNSVLQKIRMLQRNYPLKWKDTSATWAEWREKLFIEKNPDDAEVDEDLCELNVAD
ncbi:hypothetical protein B0H19DRAFT_1062847 [Mycena capillaripes]|nr:hypothetical protein B0H19DRAFT_1062847 [Mycena capillaripes]